MSNLNTLNTGVNFLHGISTQYSIPHVSAFDPFEAKKNRLEVVAHNFYLERTVATHFGIETPSKNPIRIAKIWLGLEKVYPPTDYSTDSITTIPNFSHLTDSLASLHFVECLSTSRWSSGIPESEHAQVSEAVQQSPCFFALEASSKVFVNVFNSLDQTEAIHLKDNIKEKVLSGDARAALLFSLMLYHRTDIFQIADTEAVVKAFFSTFKNKSLILEGENVCMSTNILAQKLVATEFAEPVMNALDTLIKGGQNDTRRAVDIFNIIGRDNAFSYSVTPAGRAFIEKHRRIAETQQKSFSQSIISRPDIKLGSRQYPHQ